MRRSNIPMSSPDITDAEIQAVHDVLQTPYLSIGPRIAEFEERFAAFTGARHAIAVSSGTAALHLSLIAAGVGEGDLVITTPFSFIASANCILYERAVPLFVDVDPATGNIDPTLVAEAADMAIKRQGEASTAGRLKAILPVHAFGQPADMDPLLKVAREHNLAVIEDACEAIGAKYKGRIVGAPYRAGYPPQPTTQARRASLRPATCDLRHTACFAFYPNKQMTTGEGGMIGTDNEEWADLFRSLRNQGRDVFDAWLNHTRLGYNYRLDEMSAALGLAQIQRIEELLAKRAQVADWYNQRLADVELVERPYVAPTTTRMSWFVYVVRINPPADRNALMQQLAEAGVPSRPYFTPIHLQPFYRETFGYQRGDFPVTERLGDVSLALPFSSVMTEEQVDYVCDTLRRAVEG